MAEQPNPPITPSDDDQDGGSATAFTLQGTRAEAAGLLKLKPTQLLSAKDYGTHIIAVTVDGKKLRADRTGTVPDGSSTSSIPGGRNGKK